MIAAERGSQTPADLLFRLVAALGDQPIALSAIGYTELAHGQHRSSSNLRRAIRRSFLQDLTARLPIHPYTVQAAEIAAKIDAEQRIAGYPVPFADLLIGATALSLDFSVVTLNVRHF